MATLIAFSRHTFRGTSDRIGPIEFAYGGLKLTFPSMAYAKEASAAGLVIARDFAAPALEEAAVLAMAEVGAAFPGWDAFRADFSSERTVLTADALRPSDVPLVGVPTTRHGAVDPVSQAAAVAIARQALVEARKGVSSTLLQRARGACVDLLSTLSAARGGPPITVPSFTHPEAAVKALKDIGHAGSPVEMAAALGPPLPLVLGPDVDGSLGARAVDAALRLAGLKFCVEYPGPVAAVRAFAPVAFLASTTGAVHVTSHDDLLSCLVRALGLVDAETCDDEALTIRPIETFLFARTAERAAVVRMRILLEEPLGTFPGPYRSELLWSGSRADWDAKVQAVRDAAAAWYADPLRGLAPTQELVLL